MFVSLPLNDLKALAKSGYAGAAEAVTFRERVAEMVDKLKDAVAAENKKDDGSIKRLLGEKDVTMALDELDNLAGGDVDFQGYVGRELNRGPLDTLLDAMKSSGRGGGDAMKATMAVNEALRVHTWADNVLKQVIYTKMKTEREGGAAITLLLQTEKSLRTAKTPKQFNTALKTAIDFYKNKPDKAIPSRGHKAFANALVDRLMLAA
jgi:hypothetical protein